MRMSVLTAALVKASKLLQERHSASGFTIESKSMYRPNITQQAALQQLVSALC